MDIKLILWIIILICYVIVLILWISVLVVVYKNYKRISRGEKNE